MEMRRPKAPGFTLIELIIYFGISAMALGVIVSLFALAQRTQRQTYSQYLVGGSLSSTIRLMRRELQATALASVKAYPNPNGNPGLSCASAYDPEGEFSINAYGVPHWQKHVFYHLNNDGSLVRWTKAMDDPNFLPLSTDTSPSAVESDARSIMSGTLPPNTTVPNFHPGTKFGGLEVSFVRRDNGVDTLSQVNPTDSKDYDTHTRLIEVTLRTYEERSEPDFSEVTFRVCPRY